MIEEKTYPSCWIWCYLFFVTRRLLNQVIYALLKLFLLNGADEFLSFGPVGNSPCDFDDSVGGLIFFGVFQQQIDRRDDDIFNRELWAKTHVAKHLDKANSDQWVFFDFLDWGILLSWMFLIDFSACECLKNVINEIFRLYKERLMFMI